MEKRSARRLRKPFGDEGFAQNSDSVSKNTLGQRGLRATIGEDCYARHESQRLRLSALDFRGFCVATAGHCKESRREAFWGPPNATKALQPI